MKKRKQKGRNSIRKTRRWRKKEEKEGKERNETGKKGKIWNGEEKTKTKKKRAVGR